MTAEFNALKPNLKLIKDETALWTEFVKAVGRGSDSLWAIVDSTKRAVSETIPNPVPMHTATSHASQLTSTPSSADIADCSPICWRRAHLRFFSIGMPFNSEEISALPEPSTFWHSLSKISEPEAEGVNAPPPNTKRRLLPTIFRHSSRLLETMAQELFPPNPRDVVKIEFKFF
ncbi:unknown [Coraliomargarita sp. CAG:312]|nr:unknown [Coraliomargarita sp. CAG:312]